MASNSEDLRKQALLGLPLLFLEDMPLALRARYAGQIARVKPGGMRGMTPQAIQTISRLAATKVATDWQTDFLSLYARWQDGNISETELYRGAASSLADSIRRATRGTAPASEIADQQAFLRGFVADITRRPRTRAYMDWRSGLYATRIEGYANESMLAREIPERLFQWVLDPLAEHCIDCLDTASGNGDGLSRGQYRTRELPHIPKDGTCLCKQGCKCHLVMMEG